MELELINQSKIYEIALELKLNLYILRVDSFYKNSIDVSTFQLLKVVSLRPVINRWAAYRAGNSSGLIVSSRVHTGPRV